MAVHKSVKIPLILYFLIEKDIDILLERMLFTLWILGLSLIHI